MIWRCQNPLGMFEVRVRVAKVAKNVIATQDEF